jgi:hypothetical protein
MPWTFNQRIQKACAALVERELLEEKDIVTLKRPLFFGQYAFALGFTPVREEWHRFDELKDQLTGGLEGRDYHLQTNSRTIEFHVFSSDPSVLRWVMQHQSHFLFNHLRLVDGDCWHLRLPKVRAKRKFYDMFGWRITFRDPLWGKKPDKDEALEQIGDHKLVVSDNPNKPGTFLYLSRLNDVLLFKLINAEQIQSIEDRSALP